MSENDWGITLTLNCFVWGLRHQKLQMQQLSRIQAENSELVACSLCPKCYVTTSACVPVYLTPVLTARQTERIVVETVAAPSFMQSGIGPGLWRVLVA